MELLSHRWLQLREFRADDVLLEWPYALSQAEMKASEQTRTVYIDEAVAILNDFGLSDEDPKQSVFEAREGSGLPMFFESTQIGDWLPIRLFGVQLLESVKHVGFDMIPGNATGALEDHTYCCQLGFDVCAGHGGPKPGMDAECWEWHDKKVRTRTEDANRLGVPLYMGEFGACSTSDECATEIKQVADAMDLYLGGGWAYWQFKPFNDFTTSSRDGSHGVYFPNGTLQTNKVRAIARPYVKAAQGRLNRLKVEDDWGFAAEISVDVSIDAPTVVHVYHSGKGQPIYDDSFVYKLSGLPGLDPLTKAEVVGNELRVWVKNPELTDHILRITIDAPVAK